MTAAAAADVVDANRKCPLECTPSLLEWVVFVGNTVVERSLQVERIVVWPLIILRLEWALKRKWVFGAAELQMGDLDRIFVMAPDSGPQRLHLKRKKITRDSINSTAFI